MISQLVIALALGTVTSDPPETSVELHGFKLVDATGSLLAAHHGRHSPELSPEAVAQFETTKDAP